MLESTTTGIPYLPPIPTIPGMGEAPGAGEIRVNRGIEWLRHPLGRTLCDLEITTNKTLPERDFLFRLFGKPCFSAGELVAVTGKAKSGKTFFCSALMTSALRGECLGVRRLQSETLKTLWIDTEQSEESTQDILRSRILRDTDELTATDLITINMRSLSWDQRMDYIEAAIELTAPQLVIFDGIRDVVDDINNGPLAQQVMERLLRLASQYGACIVIVLHQNKAADDKTLRGALGTELQNKSFETYECKKMEDRTFQVEQTATRKYDILDRLRFAVGPDGLPFALEARPTQGAEAAENTGEAAESAAEAAENVVEALPITPKYLRPDGLIDTQVLMADVFRERKELRSYEVKSKAMRLTNLQEQRYVAVLREAISKGWLTRREAGPMEVYYSLTPPDSSPPVPPASTRSGPALTHERDTNPEIPF